MTLLQILALLTQPLQLALFAAIFGAFFSYVSNLIARRQQRKADVVGGLAKEFLQLLDRLDDSVKNYWSASRADLGEGREIILASTIKTHLSHIPKCLQLIFMLKDSGWAAKLKRKNRMKTRRQFVALVDQINGRATDGLFDTMGRDASSETITQTSDAILDLRMRFQTFIYQ